MSRPALDVFGEIYDLSFDNSEVCIWRYWVLQGMRDRVGDGEIQRMLAEIEDEENRNDIND